MKRLKRSYDHRIKRKIALTGNPNLFPELEIPRSTAKNWINRGVGEVVSHEIFDMDMESLEQKCLELQKQVAFFQALFELIFSIFTILGFDIQYRRFNGDEKSKILFAISKALVVVPLEKCLETLHLSKQRYFHWVKRQKKCELEDLSSCPRLSPSKISAPEISIVKKFVADPRYSHFSLTSLWYYVRNKGKLVISSSSWFRIIRELKLQRENRKKYFTRPKVGFRASKPNQAWHIDVSVLRFNGVKAYVQAVRDNFSRFFLAYRVSDSYGGSHTSSLIEAAIERSKEFGYFNVAEVFSDKGGENVNSEVDELIERKLIKWMLARIDVTFSNSMIEAFFHSLKNRYLYFQDIQSFNSLEKHIDYYVLEQNEEIPLCALNGATPINAYRSEYAVIVDREQESQMVAEAMKNRKLYHQSLICPAC